MGGALLASRLTEYFYSRQDLIVFTNVQDRKPRPSVASSQLEGSRQIIWHATLLKNSQYEAMFLPH